MALDISFFSLILLTSILQPLRVISLAPGPDFSYMEVVQNATASPLRKTYDYIVVGGGTAGCPLAATLSASHSVLVLERGDAPIAHPNVLSIFGVNANLMEEDDGAHTPAEHFTSEDGVQSVRPRVLGGGSMINAGFYSRANPYFFAKSGVEWDMDAVEKAYRWVEETVVSRPRLGYWQNAVKEALLESGVVPDNGFELRHEFGTKVSGSTFDESGARHGSVEHLNKGNFENLRIVVQATVQRIVFSTEGSKPTAIGVIYNDPNGKLHRAYVRSKGEVILSAGALGSPQLLLLSGIGPKSYLSSLHIPVIHPNPNVGKFMVDNPRNDIHLVLPYPVEPSTIQVVGITRDYYIESLSFSFRMSPTPFPFAFYPTQSSVSFDIATICEKLAEPSSSGPLLLASPVDARVGPRVRFNYFNNSLDLSRCVNAMRKVGEMLNMSSMRQFRHKDITGARKYVFFGTPLPANTSDRSSMEGFCRSTLTTIWHYHGGCVVGKVVDGDYRVLGVNSLRVVDGSTFTSSPGTNPHASVMMIGRYVGLKMLQETRAPYNKKYMKSI